MEKFKNGIAIMNFFLQPNLWEVTIYLIWRMMLITHRETTVQPKTLKPKQSTYAKNM